MCGLTINLYRVNFSSLHFEIMRKLEIDLFALAFHCIALEYISSVAKGLVLHFLMD